MATAAEAASEQRKIDIKKSSSLAQKEGQAAFQDGSRESG